MHSLNSFQTTRNGHTFYSSGGKYRSNFPRKITCQRPNPIFFTLCFPVHQITIDEEYVVQILGLFRYPKNKLSTKFCLNKFPRVKNCVGPCQLYGFENIIKSNKPSRPSTRIFNPSVILGLSLEKEILLFRIRFFSNHPHTNINLDL